MERKKPSDHKLNLLILSAIQAIALSTNSNISYIIGNKSLSCGRVGNSIIITNSDINTITPKTTVKGR